MTSDLYGATVLVVEDEPAVLRLVSRILRARGYQVWSAPDPQTALSLISGSRRVDLLVTDIVMPGMRGTELARRVKALAPDTKVLFMSGYAEEAIAGAPETRDAFIAKPFTALALAAAARSVLEGRPVRPYSALG